MLLLTFLLLAGAALFTEGKSYRGHHLLSAKADTKEQLQVLQKLAENYDLVFLRGPSSLLSTDFVVPPDQMQRTMNALRDAGITVNVQSPDVQTEIDAERNEALSGKGRTRGRANILTHDRYRDLPDVVDFLLDVSRLHPDLARLEQLRHFTHGNNPVFALEIGTHDKNKPVIFIETLAHAREWLTTASVLYAISEMVDGFDRIPNITDALTRFNWFIIPLVNPDGYDYTWTGDRLWRKNRKVWNENGKNCNGVDLNRNFDSKWGEVGVSLDCNGDTYPGTGFFSEPETQNIRDSFLKQKSQIVAFLSVHSYSQILLHPWGHANTTHPADLPPNMNYLNAIAMKMLNGLQSQKKKYKYGTPFTTIGYAASGGSFDWALKEKPGIVSFCYELRPDSWWGGGFAPSDSQIVPTGKELLASFVELAKSLAP